MREILFRGKSVEEYKTGEWVRGFLFHDPEEDDIEFRTRIYYQRKADDGYCVEEWVDYTAVDSETVGQYIGLYDKKYKLIFEGDIIRDDWGKIYEVIYTEDSCSFMVQCTSAPNEYEKGRYRIGKSWCKTIEIIGNIHDNPELLKGE